MDRIVAFKVNGSFIPKKVALKPEKPYLRKRILDNLPKEIGHVVHNYNFSQVKSGEISVEKFVSSLTNQELEALTRGEGGMDSSYGVAGNAGAFGGIIPELKRACLIHVSYIFADKEFIFALFQNVRIFMPRSTRIVK